jgi:hypothetical protein
MGAGSGTTGPEIGTLEPNGFPYEDLGPLGRTLRPKDPEVERCSQSVTAKAEWVVGDV